MGVSMLPAWLVAGRDLVNTASLDSRVGGLVDELGLVQDTDFEFPTGNPDDFVQVATVGEPEGVAELDASGKIPESQIPARLTTAGLNGLYPVYRAWDGSAYPARIPGAMNVFLGPVDPGLAMGEGDYWADPGSVTMAEVVAAASNSSSTLYQAFRAASAEPKELQILVPSSSTVTRTLLGTAPARFTGWTLVKSGSPLVHTSAIKIPTGWNSVRLRALWTQTAGGTGDARFVANFTPFALNTTVTGVESQITGTAPTALQIKSTTFAPAMDLTGLDSISVTLARNSGSSMDTFAGEIHLVGLRLERAS